MSDLSTILPKRRWTIGVAGVLLGFLVLGAIVYAFSNRGPIHIESANQIQMGMTMTEVVALLGCDSGVYATGPLYVKMPLPDGSLRYTEITFQDELVQQGVKNDDGSVSYHWVGDRGCVIVDFDANRKVLRKNVLRGRRGAPSGWQLFLERKLGFE